MDEPAGPDPSHDYPVEEVDVQGYVSDAILSQALDVEKGYAFAGLALGAFVFAGGLLLGILGVAGTVNVAFQAGSAKARLTTGSIGLGVAFVGLGLVWVTRLRVRMRIERNPDVPGTAVGVSD